MNASKSKLLFLTLVVAVVGSGLILLTTAVAKAKTSNSTAVSQTNDGEQIIVIAVSSHGYSPRSVTANAGIPTIVRMVSTNAYGCERSFQFPRLGITQLLPITGTADISVNASPAGSTITGTCAMGMYSFTINFT